MSDDDVDFDDSPVILQFRHTDPDGPLALFGQCTICNGPALKWAVFVDGEWLGAGVCGECDLLSEEARELYVKDNEIVREMLMRENGSIYTIESMTENGWVVDPE